MKYTSTIVLRIEYIKKYTALITIYIEVKLDSNFYKNGLVVTNACKDLLAVHNENNIEVEIWETTVISYIKVKLKKPAFSIDLTAKFIQPLTLIFDMSICNSHILQLKGTGGFFVSDQSSVYLVTAHHVIFKAD